MTEPSTPAALATALAYHQAWTSQNLDQAMTYIADGITCNARVARSPGPGSTGTFSAGSWPSSLASRLSPASATTPPLCCSTTRILPTSATPRPPSAFTVADGKITRSVLVFDRPSFAPPQR